MSKTKWGAGLVGLGVIAGIVGNYLLGAPMSLEVIEKLLEAVGGVLVVFGIRDWELIRGLKAK